MRDWPGEQRIVNLVTAYHDGTTAVVLTARARFVQAATPPEGG